MKAALSLFVLTLVSGIIADHHPTHTDNTGHGPYNVCFKTLDTCTELKTAAKELIAQLKAKRIEKLQNPIPAATNPIELEESLPVYLTKLQNLFNISAQTDCHFEACKCKDGELKCAPMLTLLRSPLEKVKLPDCLNESEKAREILTQLKSAINDGDRQEIVDILDRLREAIILKLAKEDQDENDKLITCLRKTVKEIKTSMKVKLTKLKLQPNCEFCTVESNKLRQLELEEIHIPVPVLHQHE